MSKHTPGPWTVFNEGQCPGIDANNETCNVSIICFGTLLQDIERNGVQGRTIDECAANARLIAAAPELLEALRELDECYCEAGNDLSKEDRHRHRMTLIKARAAIAKATGENQ